MNLRHAQQPITALSRRRFCAVGLAPVIAAALPAFGRDRFETDAPALWAGVAVRAAALALAPGLPPFISARAYAMAFLAAHDALQAINPAYGTYLAPMSAPGANADAAVAAAVHGVLVKEWPFAAALLDTEYTRAIAAIKGEGSKPKGIELGQRAAAAMRASRANDGLANIDGPYVPGVEPGKYRFMPPLNFAAGVNLGTQLRPFAIHDGSDFRVAAPYAVTDAAYAADYNDVKTLGAAFGSTRTAEQSEIGKFWLENTNDSWLQVAVQLATSRDMPGWELLRAMALLQMAQVDAYIACFESKYFYNFWRPMTAIQLGDSDGNPATAGDDKWISFDFPCPPVPDYPSGHAASGGAGAAVLANVFGSDAAIFTHTSASLPGPTRNFTSFTQMADEIAVSRIYAGYHFRLAVTRGAAQGKAVTAQVLATQLPRRF